MTERERHAARAIAVTEFRCRLRALRNDPRKLVATTILLLLVGVVLPLLGFGQVSSLGRALAARVPPIGRLGVIVTTLVGGGAYLGVASVVDRGGLGRVAPLVRTATTPRAVVLGRAGSDVLVGSLFVVPFSTVVLLALLYGAGGPVVPVVVFVGLVPVLLASVLVGRAVGSTGRLLARRLGIGGWTRVVLGLAAAGVLFVGVQIVIRGFVSDSSGGQLSRSVVPGAPAQAYGRLLTVPFGGTVTGVGLAVAAAVAVTGAVTGGLAVTAERRLLVTDDEQDGSLSTSGRVPAPFEWCPATRLGWRYLLRARRNPGTLSHLFPVALGVFSFLASMVADPGLVESLGAGTVYVIAVVLAGAAFGLNPLGDERDQLPLLLSSAPSTAMLLRGRIVAGMTVATALVVAVGLPLDSFVGEPQRALLRAGFTMVLCLCAAGTALGFGAVVPTFERREYMNVERAHPSMLVLFGYLAGAVVVTVVGFALLAWTVQGGLSALVAGLWAVYLLVVGGIGLGGYVHAVRRFDRFTLDRL